MGTEKRLIDANAYDAILKNREETLIEYSGSLSGAIKGCRAILGSQPTVDAVEVVHGQWVAVPSSDMMTGKAYKCSECNKMRYGSFMPNYCQNCGAKMDGDGNG